MDPDRRLLLRRLSIVVFLLVLVYGVSLVPGVRLGAGYQPLLDVWLNLTVDVLVIAVFVVRAFADRRDRAAWLCFAAGSAVALAASVAYYAHYQHVEPFPERSWADVGWLLFYPFVYAGLGLLVRARVRRMLQSLWLDGLVAGLAAGGLAVAYINGASVSTTGGLAIAYPIADLLLFTLSVAAWAMLGRRSGPFWLLVSGAFIMLALADWQYAALLVDDAYVPGGLLDLGWLLPRLLLVVAAWVSLQATPAQPVRLDAVTVLAVPTACAAAVLMLLYHGTQHPLPPVATALALAAGLAVLARTLMTFAELRELGEARQQARTDELTGLPNRRHFYDALTRATSRLQQSPCSVILLDLDRFKEINDCLGHQTGDQLLRMVGQRLAATLRSGDVLARLGGDEYAVVVHGASADETHQLAARLRAQLSTPFTLGPATVSIDASVGIAMGPTHARNGDELFQMADLAMYAAKNEHLGVVVYDAVQHGDALNRLDRVAQLRDGIDGGQLVLHYQPQLYLRSGSVIGVEALVRWNHPAEGLLAPDKFIALAESSGLMGALTSAVLDDALGQRRRWHDEGLELRVAINVSPSALVNADFPASVQDLLIKHNVPSHALILEVTEDLLMNSRERAAEALSALRHAGVQISIDDYGTGYSSLAYLRDLPVSELKLDRSFVSNMDSSPVSAAIVHSTITMAHALGLELVAEGVENAAALSALRAGGCDLVQGYFLSPPVPAQLLPSILLDVKARANTYGAEAVNSDILGRTAPSR